MSNFSGITLWFKYYLDILTCIDMYWFKPSLRNWETLGGTSQNNWVYYLGNIRFIALLLLGRGMPLHTSPAEKYLELYLQYENHQQRNNWVGITLIIKGCVRYIFASLFFKSMNNIFCFTSKVLFDLKEIKFYNFQIFKFHDVIKCLSIK